MTKSVVMLANVFDADRVLLVAGTTVTVDDSVAYDLIGNRRARWASDPIESPTPTAAVSVGGIAQVLASDPPVKAGVMLVDPITELIYGQSDGNGGYASLLGGGGIDVQVAAAVGTTLEV